MSKEQQAFHIRYTEPSDGEYLLKWLSEPGITKWFPCEEKIEIEDTVRMLMNFSKWKCSLTIEVDKKPVGVALLYLHAYKKIAHQCLFGIIMDKDYRGKGLGTQLMHNLFHLAKNNFKIEVLYLEVFEGNPAISLYRRLGFTEVGYQKHWIKDKDGYLPKITMEKIL